MSVQNRTFKTLQWSKVKDEKPWSLNETFEGLGGVLKTIPTLSLAKGTGILGCFLSLMADEAARSLLSYSSMKF